MADNKKEVLETLEEHEKYLEAWLEGYDRIQKEAPRVRQQLEQIRWQREAAKSAPLPSDDPFFAQLTDLTAGDFSATRRSVPELPIINPSAIINSVTGSTSTTLMVFDCTFQARKS